MQDTEEIWKAIPNYDGYLVSSLGRVKSFKRKKPSIILPFKSWDGYLSVRIARKAIKVHKLVILAFVGLDTTLVIDHVNRKRDDNRLENLRQISNRENTTNKKPHHLSKFPGVKKTPSNKWQAAIYVKPKLRYLGTFDTELKAADAYKDALKELNLNFSKP